MRRWEKVRKGSGRGSESYVESWDFGEAVLADLVGFIKFMRVGFGFDRLWGRLLIWRASPVQMQSVKRSGLQTYICTTFDFYAVSKKGKLWNIGANSKVGASGSSGTWRNRATFREKCVIRWTMHEEATSISVPGPVAASLSQNGTSQTVSVLATEMELEVGPDNDSNVELDVNFTSNAEGNVGRQF